jgi:hypothetical protein
LITTAAAYFSYHFAMLCYEEERLSPVWISTIVIIFILNFPIFTYFIVSIWRSYWPKVKSIWPKLKIKLAKFRFIRKCLSSKSRAYLLWKRGMATIKIELVNPKN